MASARAVWFVRPDEVELRSEPLPPVGPGQVQVTSIVSAISHGTELLVLRGEAPPDLPLDLPTLAGDFGLPMKYGYAVVGRVDALGDDVEGTLVGDLVFAFHPHQDRFNAPANLVQTVPTGIAVERALFYANLETALNALLDQPIRLAERVVVIGQGIVGLLIALLARRNGAGKVITVDRWKARLALSRRLVADETIDAAEDPVARILDSTSGRGADVVFEASGDPRGLQTALDAVAAEGSVIACSWYGVKPVSLALGGHFHRGRVRVRSSQVGSIHPDLAPRWNRARRSATVLGLLAELPLDDVISHRFPLYEAAEAYRLLRERPEETVQIVFDYGGDTTGDSSRRS